ncbi:MAG: ankyrin repeat domain-containing protein [Deltaproteobacteria bacterium]|nr:ankyrin repeat domain-containing protein [Deltaproteobacteria bacterium]
MKILLSVLFVLLGSSLAMGRVSNPGDTDLVSAVKNGNLEAVESLLNNGVDVDVNANDENNATPLHWAAMNGHTAVAGLLIEKGADVNAAGDGSWTPLHLAAVEGHKDVAELLIAAGTDVNAVNNDGDTPLHWAAVNGHTVFAALLIAAGADVNAVDRFGFTHSNYAEYYAKIRSRKVRKQRLKNAGIVGLASVALVGAVTAGYNYFASEAESDETPEDEIIGAMDTDISSVLDGADPLLLPESESDLVPVL